MPGGICFPGCRWLCRAAGLLYGTWRAYYSTRAVVSSTSLSRCH